MLKKLAPALVLSLGSAALALPALAQTSAPATVETVIITPPEGFSVIQLVAISPDEVKMAKVYDVEGNTLGEVQDVVVGADGAIAGVVADFGGYIGHSKHLLLLGQDQIHIYKNTKNEVRTFVTMTKDELSALPVFRAPVEAP